MATIVNTLAPAMEAPHSSSPLPPYRTRTTEQHVNAPSQPVKKTKYRHVFATHSQSRMSCLTHGAPMTPSFVGFRNLMILVLGAHSSLATAAHAEPPLTATSLFEPAIDD